jgi:hypothetical protein
MMGEPQRGRTRRGTAALALAVCVLALGLPFKLGSAVAQSDSARVLVATTGKDSELRQSIPITRASGMKPRVVMSMGPALLPSLASGDRLQAPSEVEVSTDCPEKMPRCIGRPYAYNPIVQARVVLADGPSVAAGEGALELGAQRLKCRQKPPDREHHCVFTFIDTTLDIPDRGQLPCAPGSCYLNMVVEAHNPRKKRGKKGRRNRLIIGKDEPDGTVVQDKGRVNAIRFSPGDQPPIPSQVSSTPLNTSVQIRKGDKFVIFSRELNGLERNEQLFVHAGMTTTIGSLSYPVLIRSRLILAPEPTATRPGRQVKGMTQPAGEIAQANGFNCTPRNPVCPTNKVGVTTLIDDPKKEAGEPVPLYANLVLNTAKPGAIAPAGDVVQVLGGGISVTVFPAGLRG